LDTIKEARTSVQIVSAFASAACLEKLKTPLIEAVERGVYVELLWGYAASAETLDWCRKVEFDCRKRGVKGVFRFNTEPSQSHAKMLLADRCGHFEAVIGSHNWLSAMVDTEDEQAAGATHDISIKLTHAGLLADIARCIASFWGSLRSERLSATADRSRRRAAEFSKLESEMHLLAAVPTAAPNAIVSVIRDRDHEHLMRQWFAAYNERFLVASHRIGPAAETRLVSDQRSPLGASRTFTVGYGHGADDPAVVSRVKNIVEARGGQLVFRERLHAKLIVADNLACVTSYNFLSADAFGTANKAREVGVLISGAEPVGWLAEALLAEVARR
jgi:phosphatidylserine/phosphatidylglycerophosphate/cardiolipin synthase-like enzyme